MFIPSYYSETAVIDLFMYYFNSVEDFFATSSTPFHDIDFSEKLENRIQI